MTYYKKTKGTYYKKIDENCWVDICIPSVGFPEKPPEWIHQYLLKVYSDGYNRGKSEAKNVAREFFDYFEMINED